MSDANILDFLDSEEATVGLIGRGRRAAADAAPPAAPEDKELRMDEARALLNQVYKFSRMYWKSVKQQNLPITIKYPEMVAELVPHFRKEELPAFGKTNLWFL